MKVYMSVDLEGITGVVGSKQVMKNPGALPEVRELVTGDVNAAIEGAKEAGADTIWVNENHSGYELLFEKIDPIAEVLLGNPKPLQTIDGIDSSFDCVFMIGLHAQGGTESAVLDHTWKPKITTSLHVNGIKIGELGLNALVAGHFDVPVVLITGDDAAARESKALLGDVECAVVKYGIDRYSARCLHPSITREIIKKAASRAIQEIKRFKPFKLQPPYEIEIEYANSAFATRATWIPGAKRTGPFTVSFIAPDFIVGVKTFFAAATLPNTIMDPMF